MKDLINKFQSHIKSLLIFVKYLINIIIYFVKYII